MCLLEHLQQVGFIKVGREIEYGELLRRTRQKFTWGMKTASTIILALT